MPLQTHPVTKVHRHVLFFLFLKTQKVKGHYPLLFAFNNTLGILTTGPPGSPLCVCVCSIALLYLTLADAEAEAPVFWSSDADRQLIGNVPDAGKD